MKRDMDLIRKLLLYLETMNPYDRDVPIRIDGYRQDQIEYHGYLLVDAGLATGVAQTTLANRQPEYYLTGLTWAGREFLDAARNETHWKKAKEAVAGVGGFTLGILQALLVAYTKEQLGLGKE